MLGCNHLFYYPTKVIYSTPQELGLTYQDDWLTQANGERLHLWHLEPLPGAPRRQAVIVHFHGNAQNMSSHFHFVGWLAHAGFSVVTFDYRGYGQSDGRPTRSGTVEDGKAVLAKVLGDPRYQGQSLFVIGQSLGGAVAIPAIASLLQQEPGFAQHLRGMVIEAAFDSYREVARSKLSAFWLTWPLQYPLVWSLLSNDHNAIDAVGQIPVPMLFVYETHDPVIPYQCGLNLYAAATACKDKDFWSIQSHEHTAAWRDEESPYRVRLVDWLDQRLR